MISKKICAKINSILYGKAKINRKIVAFSKNIEKIYAPKPAENKDFFKKYKKK